MFAELEKVGNVSLTLGVPQDQMFFFFNCVRDLWTREPDIIVSAANAEIPVHISSKFKDIMEQLAPLPPEILNICAIVQQLLGFSFVCMSLAPQSPSQLTHEFFFSFRDLLSNQQTIYRTLWLYF